MAASATVEDLEALEPVSSILLEHHDIMEDVEKPMALVKLEEEVQEEPESQVLDVKQKRLDLIPVQAMLVRVAVKLEAKLMAALIDLNKSRINLAEQMRKTALALEELGEICVSGRMDTSTEEQHETVLSTIGEIHKYRDVAAAALQEHANIIDNCPIATQPSVNLDFCSVSDSCDSMFQQMKSTMEVISSCGKRLQTNSSLNTSVAKFSSVACSHIDTLEKSYVMDKLRQKDGSLCSVQSRKPVRSLGHTLDLQDIMLVAKNAKSHVYEICLHLLKIVDKVKSEEIKSTTVYHKLNKENSELLRRYCFYLKLKIIQL